MDCDPYIVSTYVINTESNSVHSLTEIVPVDQDAKAVVGISTDRKGVAAFGTIHRLDPYVPINQDVHPQCFANPSRDRRNPTLKRIRLRVLYELLRRSNLHPTDGYNTQRYQHSLHVTQSLHPYFRITL